MKAEDIKETTDETLIKLVRSSALDVVGVTAMAEDAEGLKPNILARDVLIREGIRLARDKEGKPILDVYIRVNYGIKIPQLAWEIQKKIQGDVKEKTGIVLNDINIHVEGVDMGDEND